MEPSHATAGGRHSRDNHWKRTRSGCLNCRRKRRKCDEAKPTCQHCCRGRETCKWGMRISFRAENTQTVQVPLKTTRAPKHFEILDVTSEVIRDYRQLVPSDEFRDAFHDAGNSTQPEGVQAEGEDETSPRADTGIEPPPNRWNSSRKPSPREGELHANVSEPAYSVNTEEVCAPLVGSYPEENAAVVGSTDSPAANNGWLQQVLTRDLLPERNNNGGYHTAAYSPLSQQSQSVQGGYSDDPISLFDFNTQDGIFLPGSEYHELHSTLRNHLFLEARSTAPTRPGTPNQLGRDISDNAHMPVSLSREEEYTLWKNWIDELAPWLDKFDTQCHFQTTITAMARSHEHLRHSILAVSARQLERKGATPHKERSLELYHNAIHLLLPLLPTRSTAVIASCVVLCVLEMLSCAPKAWRRHLDGCAGLLEAAGINGFVGGPEQALFWCFARMDVCGGLITSTKTLIFVNHWASGMDLDADALLFQADKCFDTYANFMVYLFAQVLDVLAPCYYNFGRISSARNSSHTTQNFSTRWSKLWFYIQDWYINRPEPMKSIMNCPSPKSSFPTILFASPAGISGNQLYHTASLLMLQAQPPGLCLDPKPRSALWHARQVCGISISNHHHGAWTNAIQPLWIAGQWMSHPTEHAEILELLRRIEDESGWPTQWRADDLKEFWGDLGQV